MEKPNYAALKEEARVSTHTVITGPAVDPVKEVYKLLLPRHDRTVNAIIDKVYDERGYDGLHNMFMKEVHILGDDPTCVHIFTSNDPSHFISEHTERGTFKVSVGEMTASFENGHCYHVGFDTESDQEQVRVYSTLGDMGYLVNQTHFSAGIGHLVRSWFNTDLQAEETMNLAFHATYAYLDAEHQVHEYFILEEDIEGDEDYMAARDYLLAGPTGVVKLELENGLVTKEEEFSYDFSKKKLVKDEDEHTDLNPSDLLYIWNNNKLSKVCTDHEGKVGFLVDLD